MPSLGESHSDGPQVTGRIEIIRNAGPGSRFDAAALTGGIGSTWPHMTNDGVQTLQLVDFTLSPDGQTVVLIIEPAD